MNRNIKVLALSGLSVAIVAKAGQTIIKRIREKQENSESESKET